MKTFYSVECAVLGAGTRTAWFDNKEAAQNFYIGTDNADAPVAHRASKPETIEKMEYLVATSSMR